MIHRYGDMQPAAVTAVTTDTTVASITTAAAVTRCRSIAFRIATVSASTTGPAITTASAVAAGSGDSQACQAFRFEDEVLWISLTPGDAQDHNPVAPVAGGHCEIQIHALTITSVPAVAAMATRAAGTSVQSGGAVGIALTIVSIHPRGSHRTAGAIPP